MTPYENEIVVGLIIAACMIVCFMVGYWVGAGDQKRIQERKEFQKQEPSDDMAEIVKHMMDE